MTGHKDVSWTTAINMTKRTEQMPQSFKSLIENIPHKIKSIQLDGGSEFMKDFEKTCEKLKIPLFVLPPAKPLDNEKVKRRNRISREEFYDDLIEDIVGSRRDLKNKRLHLWGIFLSINLETHFV